MMWVNDVARGSRHLYLYDYETLEFVSREGGFEKLRRGRANDSSFPEFANEDMAEPLRSAITVYIEGRRP